MNMQKIFTTLALTLLFSLAIETAFAQKNMGKSLYPGRKKAMNKMKLPSKKAEDLITVYAGTGSATYYGDLCHLGECLVMSRTLINGGAYYRINNHFSIFAELAWVRLSADDAKTTSTRTGRNLHFRSDNYTFSLGGKFDILKVIDPFKSTSSSRTNYHARRNIMPYVFAGAGVMYFNPKAQTEEGAWVELRPLKTEAQDNTYKEITPIIFGGPGVRLKLSENLDAAFEVNYHKTFTDYLDDVSTDYPTKEEKQDMKAVAIEMSDRRLSKNELPSNVPEPSSKVRGNPEKKDGYFLLNLKFEYTLTSKLSELFNFKGSGGGRRRRRRR